jgi:opacity protein-like surface antigen
VHELLPDLGRIGSEVAAFGGASWNPYDVGQGFQVGGLVDLPLFRLPGGKLSYELLIALSGAHSDPFTITDLGAYLANLAAGASPSAARAGPPYAPFPLVRSVRTRLRVLQISPAGFKHTIQALDRLRLRPYLDAGFDFLVVLTSEEPDTAGGRPVPVSNAANDALGGAFPALAPELVARGIPSGQGTIEIGFHAGGGIEIRVSGGISLNLDYRFTGIGGTQQHLHAASFGLGFHW